MYTSNLSVTRAKCVFDRQLSVCAHFALKIWGCVCVFVIWVCESWHYHSKVPQTHYFYCHKEWITSFIFSGIRRHRPTTPRNTWPGLYRAQSITTKMILCTELYPARCIFSHLTTTLLQWLNAVAMRDGGPGPSKVVVGQWEHPEGFEGTGHRPCRGKLFCSTAHLCWESPQTKKSR